MNILISTQMPKTYLLSYINVGKAFVYAGHDVMLWDGNKPPYDVWDELKPSVFISNNMNDTESKLCQQYNTKHFVSKPSSLWADVFLFKTLKPSEAELEVFGCDNCCIINGERDEIDVVKEILGPNTKVKTKLFSPHIYIYQQYCQGLPENLYSLALCSAKTVYATNYLNMLNFVLANENTISPSCALKCSKSEVLDGFTCFHGANRVAIDCGLEIDFMSLYGKFMESYNV